MTSFYLISLWASGNPALTSKRRARSCSCSCAAWAGSTTTACRSTTSASASSRSSWSKRRNRKRHSAVIYFEHYSEVCLVLIWNGLTTYKSNLTVILYIWVCWLNFLLFSYICDIISISLFYGSEMQNFNFNSRRRHPFSHGAVARAAAVKRKWPWQISPSNRHAETPPVVIGSGFERKS